MVNLDWVLLGLRILTTIILYLFLGFAFYILWRDLKQADQTVTVKHVESGSKLHLLFPSEAETAEMSPIFPLLPVTFLGRDLNNTIVINDAAASGRHARISRENGIWWLEDLGSKNGTILNDLPLVKTSSLVDGDIIGIGNIFFRIELGEEI